MEGQPRMATIGWKPSTRYRQKDQEKENKKITEKEKYTKKYEGDDGQYQRFKEQRTLIK